MARPLRIEYEGALYHVLSRGNNKQTIFRSDPDRRTFLKTLARMSERFEVDIFAFVLMDNHYHLLLRTNRANLSKSMQWLGTTYTTIFNLRNSQKGHLFQGRFKSILVENESYLTQLSCYIHRNPLRAGLVQRMVHYPWSSYPAYAYERDQTDWLNTDMILSRFGTGSSARKAYREKVQRYADERKSIWEDIKHGMILGSQGFISRIKKNYLNDTATEDVPEQKKILNDVDLGELIESGARILKVDLQKLKNSRRVTKTEMINRDILVYYLWQRGQFSNSEIGSHVGRGVSSVSRRVGIFQSLLDRDKAFQARYDNYNSIIKVWPQKWPQKRLLRIHRSLDLMSMKSKKLLEPRNSCRWGN